MTARFASGNSSSAVSQSDASGYSAEAVFVRLSCWKNSSVFFRITSISASSRSSATMTISFADACISSGVCRPLCIKMSLFAGVPIIMDAFCTPSITCMQFVRSISATES